MTRTIWLGIHLSIYAAAGLCVAMTTVRRGSDTMEPVYRDYRATGETPEKALEALKREVASNEDGWTW